MIFVTSGLQLPFDRLITYIESLVTKKVINEKVIIQSFTNKNLSHHSIIELVNHISISEFERLIEESNLVISHAGMGTILTCAQYNKSLIVVPREHARKEHRNDHQLSTCKAFESRGIFSVAKNEEKLAELFLNGISSSKRSSPQIKDEAKSVESLVTYIDSVVKDI